MFIVATAKSRQSAVPPGSRSSKAILIPRAACAPSMRPASSAISTVTGRTAHVTAKFFAEGFPARAAGFARGTVEALGQFDDDDAGERGINFSVCGMHPRKDLPHTVARTVTRDRDAGVENHSHIAEWRGLRRLRISAKSAAKSASSLGSCPSSLACASTLAMDSESGRPPWLSGKDHCKRQDVPLDDNFFPRVPRCQHTGKIAVRFRLRDMDHGSGHSMMIPVSTSACSAVCAHHLCV